MTINQLVELIRHIEEEHNFFNRKPGQRVVKQITPHINTRGAGRVIAVDLQGYGWDKVFAPPKGHKELPVSMYHSIMDFLDTPVEDR
ncbi:hypothetical protein F6V25_02210 [Oryzomonas japonica]|uniref:Uncharacterized protein n=1 Tax=Oryzomonas japonica TaxID=2603858 RepID=A0A7J4ZVB4_9BACT|nr:hypothetical protein [Oryzomonas japonica]KAB0667534.1 hypothetical protein F6V25_02210 [Oryzomonas japonica]